MVECKKENWGVISKNKNISNCPIHNTMFDSDSIYGCPKTTPSFPKELSKKSKKDVSSNLISNSQAIVLKEIRSTNLSEISNSKISIGNKGIKKFHSKRRYVKKSKDSIYERFHNYGIKFNAIIDHTPLFKEETININKYSSYKKLSFPLAIVKVFKSSILVTLRSSEDIKRLSVKDALNVANLKVSEVIGQLPKCIQIQDSKRISIHNAFVNHPMAKHDINVKINNESRIISDHSKGYIELEAINKDFAITDSEAIEHDMVSLIDKGLSRDFIASALNDLIKDRSYYAENLRSHVQSIKDLGDATKVLSSKVDSLSFSRDSQTSPSVPTDNIFFKTISRFDSLEEVRRKKIEFFKNKYR